MIATQQARAAKRDRPRWTRGRFSLVLVIVLAPIHVAFAAPRVPLSDAEVLAEVPAGAAHPSSPSSPSLTTSRRLDIALPLAQFDITQARATGDLRFLGYAEAILAPWMTQPAVVPQVLILDATILQSRHAFEAALAELDRALQARPDDAQGWLTRATVLRVLGRYDEAMASCGHLSVGAGSAITTLCAQSLRGLTGHLREAYQTISALTSQDLPLEVRAWRYSELGEMAERLGLDQAAEHWFREGLALAPKDFYMRTACADVLLRHDRAAETLELLSGYESMEPMLLRIAIAHENLHDGLGSRANAQLSSAFDVEQQRGDAVHRREQARFLLDVARRPAAAVTAALENWRVQREPDDVLILLRAARAANQPQAAAAALEFLRRTGLEDTRVDPYRASS